MPKYSIKAGKALWLVWFSPKKHHKRLCEIVRYIVPFITHDTVLGAKGCKTGKKNEFYLKIGKMYPFLPEIIDKVFHLHVAVDSLEIGGYLLKSLGML